MERESEAITKRSRVDFMKFNTQNNFVWKFSHNANTSNNNNISSSKGTQVNLLTRSNIEREREREKQASNLIASSSKAKLHNRKFA